MNANALRNINHGEKMIYIARAGSYKNGDAIEIPDGSLGITTEKTVMLNGLVVTWLEPEKKLISKDNPCIHCATQCYEKCNFYKGI